MHNGCKIQGISLISYNYAAINFIKNKYRGLNSLNLLISVMGQTLLL